MTYTPKEIGDAVGVLFGVAVEVCKSHHEAHYVTPDPKGKKGKKGEKKAPSITGEISSATATMSQQCDASWTSTPGQTRVAVDAAATMTLAPATMARLPAGEIMSTATQAGDPLPNQIGGGQGGSVTPVTISINPSSGRGLYVGRLRSTAGVALDEPVLIYIDEVV
jgi:hypothetical protein